MHADEASRLLNKAGFQRLSEASEWHLKAGGRYYFTRNLTTIVAFAVGADFKAGNGFNMIGAHTDRCEPHLHNNLLNDFLPIARSIVEFTSEHSTRVWVSHVLQLVEDYSHAVPV